MNTKNNARRQETFQRIKDAYLHLLQTKAVGEVTVTDICAQAGIDRSTFYACFDDLASLNKDMVLEMESLLETIGKETMSSDASMQDFSWLFTYVQDHPSWFKAYLDISDSVDVLDSSDNYRLLFFKRGLRGLVKQWVDDGCVESAAKMNEIVLHHCRPEFFCQESHKSI